mmetsp:Transcript_29634/g.47727  ORF Transcript_29634/g.47727 Transcript_29634/m.47727 type:complete len:574 (+) Transcript_29634:71-1792(+)
MFIYHERQLGGLCGVHCLNNLLQGPQFGPGDLAEIGMKLDQEERSLFGGAEGEHQPYNVDSSADGGNFSIQVLTLALKKFSLELVPAKHPSVKELMKDPPKAAEAFLCQYKDHWFAVRAVNDCWWNMNSTRPRPGLVSDFYLAAWLAQLSAEGHSIFLVLGKKLPDPAKPQQEDRPTEENFFEFNDLLEKAKDPNDRPLQGGEAAADDFPHDTGWQDESWESAVSSTSPPYPNQAWESAGFGGYMGSGALGGPDSVIESQRRLLEQAGARTGNGMGRGSSVVPHTGMSAVESQRRLLEEAQRNANSSRAQATSTQPLPKASPQSQVLDQQRRLLEEANRRAIAQQQAKAPAQPPLANSAQNRVLEEQRRLLEEAGRRAASQQQGEHRRQRPSLGHGALDYKALQEMGFKDPQIRTVEALTRGSKAIMTDMLLRVKGIPANVERVGEKLAETIQGAVLEMDRRDLSPEAVLDLVTLLCLPQERLEAAGAHFEPEVLTEFLLSVFSKYEKTWSPEIVEAVSVSVELLASIPRKSSARRPGVSLNGQRVVSGVVRVPRGDDTPASLGEFDDGMTSL